MTKWCDPCPLNTTCKAKVPRQDLSPHPIMMVAERPLSLDEFAMWKKLLRSANIAEAIVFLTYLVRAEGAEVTKVEIATCKQYLWDEIKGVAPKHIITMGLVPSRVLLRGKSTMRLKDVAHKSHKVDYHTASIVPIPSLSYLLSHSINEIKETVRTLKRSDWWYVK